MQYYYIKIFLLFAVSLLIVQVSSLRLHNIASFALNTNSINRIDASKFHINDKSSIFINSNRKANLNKINNFNAQANKKFTMAANDFIGLSEKEWEATYLDIHVNDIPKADVQLASNFTTDIDPYFVATTVDFYWIFYLIDWSKNYVTPVKNQGACGSCWAFSANAAIQSGYKFISYNLDLSEQQLVDCSGIYGNHGCSGGWMNNAFNYVKNRNINTQSQYPYHAVNQVCKIGNGVSKGYYTIKNYYNANGCTAMFEALKYRPLSVAVDASGWGYYSSGYFSNCGTNVNHGVQLVGANYWGWLIKNSWGTGWGSNGYMWIYRYQNGGNACSICSYASYPYIF